MKITNIEKKDGIYYVTTKPRWFGKEKIIRYKKDTSRTYIDYPDLEVFINSDGEEVYPFSKLHEVLDNYDRRF